MYVWLAYLTIDSLPNNCWSRKMPMIWIVLMRWEIYSTRVSFDIFGGLFSLKDNAKNILYILSINVKMNWGMVTMTTRPMSIVISIQTIFWDMRRFLVGIFMTFMLIMSKFRIISLFFLWQTIYYATCKNSRCNDITKQWIHQR